MNGFRTAPRLAVIVANNITGDSRVQKAAIAAARDGWDVTVVGRSLSKQREESMMGPVKVLRLPVLDNYRQYRRRQGRNMRCRLTQAGLPDRNALNRYRGAHDAWRLRQETRLAADTATWLNPSRRAWMRMRHDVYRLRNRLWRWEEDRISAAGAATGDWRRDVPEQVDRDLAFVPVLVDLAPDVIHANDITTISTAAQAVVRLRRGGHRVNWLYDAHEYVRGFEWTRPQHAHGFPAMEREFIHRADAVVTVSPQLAELLREAYDLAQAPLVVRNAPIQEVIGAGDTAVSVRQAAGLGAGVPLLVYAGWIGPERGLGTAIRALPALPGFHLAIVANRHNAELRALLGDAVERGVRDRVHVVPYVAQHLVPDYLASADLGIVCFRHTPNCEVSLPTKVPEYLHARLPLVVSDIRVVGDFVRQHGFGEVFTAEDERSFAEAVSRAHAGRAALAARITEDVLRDLSWEHQSGGLVQLYRHIAPRTPETTRPTVSWTVRESAETPAQTDPATRGWRPLASTGTRLGVGPANYAGQAAGFAQAVCRLRDDVSAEVFMYRSAQDRCFPADVYLDDAQLNQPELQVEQVRRIRRRYTHLLAEAFRPVFGRLNGYHIGADLPMLASAGIKVALLAHGTEVRDPARHLAEHPFSHFRDAEPDRVANLTAITERNRRVAEQSGLPVYVTTPDLLDDLPWATWTPLVVDVDAWYCDRPVMERVRPVVLLAPSARWTKGTDRVLPVLEDLDRRGAIELRLAEQVQWAEMRKQIHDADVVIDQFTTGAYGALSCEAMAAGRVVVAYLSDRVKAVAGADLPIVEATPDTLATALQSLIDDRDHAAKTGAASREFAVTHHNGERTARALSDFLT
ncbi:glycosyltransferase involved in cell wall biosynthesis [Krasilnikovia cinnamomea]|uniref:Glycosyltransferase involved in cell wall biosynthesis n=1 Tax=Krasilnikovia cinnamomea TaxID=349313 RepID=A0A4Q7ZPX0_9ACTN|nr:glycosyltransferase [Krasilnikovia cinnamomea]RZU52399.1 glycosyltransferase involved in cell wall biosynthesis [Krasilnikovia cinnamomea]